MNSLEIACFGASEKGIASTLYLCYSLPELLDQVGYPPPETRGIYYAVQALLYQHGLIFIPVVSEGYSYEDYILGFRKLLERESVNPLAAICLPGVGSEVIMAAASKTCFVKKSLLITSEADLYDYLTEKRAA